MRYRSENEGLGREGVCMESELLHRLREGHVQVRGVAESDDVHWEDLFNDGVRSLADFQDLLKNPEQVEIQECGVNGVPRPCFRLRSGRRVIVVTPEGLIIAASVEA